MTNHTDLLQRALDVITDTTEFVDFSSHPKIEDELWEVMIAIRTVIEGDDDDE